jgi:glycolate oxidase FAD binding subunit
VTQNTCLIDDFGPLEIIQAQSVAEVSDLVRRAAGQGSALYPVGGQTMLDYGLPPAQPGRAVSLCHLDKVIDYPARDMTVTVQAGLTLAKLQKLLATENQRLPIDVPQAEQATLGGVLATNVSGPRRYGFGTLRDYVIGISVVNDEGHEIKAGGRVVKNVAGYDLCKLFIGSLGTLGILTQVTLKLKPRPEEQALVLVSCQTERLGPLLEQLHGSRTRPVCIDLLNEAAIRQLNQQSHLLPDAPWLAILGLENIRDAVSWQIQQLIRELGTGASLEARLSYTTESLWQALTEFPGWREASLTFKANLRPSATAAFVQQVSEVSEELLLQAHAGNGIVIGHAPPGLTLERAQAMLKRLLELAKAAQGNVVVLRCPAAWKKALPIWGNPRGDFWFMRTIKERLDPRRLFNPGRFVDGM